MIVIGMAIALCPKEGLAQHSSGLDSIPIEPNSSEPTENIPLIAPPDEQPNSSSESTVVPEQFQNNRLELPQNNSQTAIDLLDYLAPNPNPLSLPTTLDEVEIQTTQGISLEQALQLATRNSCDLEQALLSLERAQAVLREQIASLYPNLSASAQADYSNPVEASSNDTATISGGLSASYTVFDFGQRRYNIEIARDRVVVAELEAERINQSIRLEVAGYYYDL